MNAKRRIAAIVGGLALLIPLAACTAGGGDSSTNSASGTVNWWTWDANQATAYKKCLPGFEKENPDITVKISQYTYNDYWTKLTAGFIGGNAPDAFMNGNIYTPEFAKQGQLLALNSYLKKSDYNLDASGIGMAQWPKYPDGNYYGVPKDFSTQGLYYTTSALKDAGISADQLENATWNPTDGGSFQKIIEHLTIDKNGVRGDEAGFDKNNVKTYGISSLEGGNLDGQTTWAQFAPTTGWTPMAKGNFPDSFEYNDSRFLSTIAWATKMSDDGFAPKFNQFSNSGDQLLGSGTIAIALDGSWLQNSYSKIANVAVAMPPVGPNGKRAAEAASIGNNIWKGSKNPDAAWKWISYMSSTPCETIVGTSGSILPNDKDALAASSEALKKKGFDNSALVDQVNQDGMLWYAPLYSGGTQVQSSLVPMTEQYWTGAAPIGIWKTIATKSQSVLAANK